MVWTAGKNLAQPDTLSRNRAPELMTRKTTVEIPQKIKKISLQKMKHHQDYNAIMQ